MINIVLLSVVIVLLLVLSMLWPPDSPWAPWWRMNKKVSRAACRLAKIDKRDVVYDLGCGDGTALLTAAKEFGAKCVGIEIDPIRSFVSKLRFRLSGASSRLTIKKNNFFDEDISGASVVIVYLVPRVLNKLLPKFKKELKKGTRIISYRYDIKMPLNKEDKKNELKMYVV